MSTVAIINLIENIASFINNPSLKAGYLLSKSFIVLLQNAFAQDTSKVLKRNIADSELECARSVLNSINLEAECNRKNGINRAITHLESAFNLYVNNDEFPSSCICALYLSLMHKIIGNINDEFHMIIWLKVPIFSKEATFLGEYGSYVKCLFSDEAYNILLAKRCEKRINIIDAELKLYRLIAPTLQEESNSASEGMLQAIGKVCVYNTGRLFLGRRIADLEEEKYIIQKGQKFSPAEKIMSVFIGGKSYFIGGKS